MSLVCLYHIHRIFFLYFHDINNACFSEIILDFIEVTVIYYAIFSRKKKLTGERKKKTGSTLKAV